MQSSADALFAEYGAYHTDRRNRVCHEIGIPLIVLAIEALLRALPAGGLIALALTAALCAYYLTLAGARAIAAVGGMLVLWYLASYVSWPWAIALFVIGWIFQFVGHAYEGRKPAFLTNLVHLLIGPLWIGHILTTPRSSSSAR
ncbi:MAG TPA: Mpo1-like protein [Candidatus Sulfotelmatobacter sp.]|nr:Mpo1-like protein [Candidatus Sulfotelmatobacter sp.]